MEMRELKVKELLKMNKLETDEEKTVYALSCVLDKDEEEILNLPISEFEKLTTELNK